MQGVSTYIFVSSDFRFDYPMREVWIIVAAFAVSITCYGAVAGPRGWLALAFPSEVSAVGSVLLDAFYLVLAAAITQVSMSMICAIHGWAFAFSGVMCVLMLGFIFFFVPETLDVSNVDIIRVWGQHWYWRRLYRSL